MKISKENADLLGHLLFKARSCNLPFTRSLKSSTCNTILAVLLSLACSAVWAQNVKLYRYKNENGTEVINHFIPPKYAQDGYEILNSQGEVVQTVDPAPSNEEISKRQMVADFDKLYRRFRSIDEIERAKQRVLVNIDSSLRILEGNITVLNAQLAKQVGQAATIERRGRTIPKHIIDSIDATKVELNVTRELLDRREVDKAKEVSTYEEYKVLFVKGSALKRELYAESR